MKRSQWPPVPAAYSGWISLEHKKRAMGIEASRLSQVHDDQAHRRKYDRFGDDNLGIPSQRSIEVLQGQRTPTPMSWSCTPLTSSSLASETDTDMSPQNEKWVHRETELAPSAWTSWDLGSCSSPSTSALAHAHAAKGDIFRDATLEEITDKKNADEQAARGLFFLKRRRLI